MSTAEAVPKIAAEKPKKAPANKTKSGKSASHPPYFEMIKDALLALKEKGGSSPYAISKYIEEKHKAALPINFRKILGLQLKNCAAKGKLIKVKASYKLSESAKKEKKASKKKVEKVTKADAVKPEKKASKKKVKVKKTDDAAKSEKKAAGPVKKPAKSVVKNAEKVAA